MAQVITRPLSPFHTQHTQENHASPQLNSTIPSDTPAGGPIGERLVVHTVDELARRTPDRIYATVSKSRYDLDQGFRDVTVAQLANAVNTASWFIHDRVGRSEDFSVIAYIGVSDLRYAFFTYASIKTGHVIMIPSVRNSLSQHLAVFEEAKCDKVFYTPEMQTRINEIKESMPKLQAFEVPDLDGLLSQSAKHYEYKRTWAKGRTDPIIIAHSSGSTGNPKPTTITNGVYSTYDSHRKIPPVPGRKIQGYNLLEFDDNGRFFCPFPPFHLAGMFGMTIMPIFYSSTVMLGPPEKPPSGELVSQALKMVKFRGAWCPPSVIEQLAALPGGLEQIASLDWMIYTGGPLAPAVGDVVSKVTDLCQLYGSTETGPQIALIPRKENWNWFEWHPILKNTMDPMGDGTYEMVCYKNPEWDHILHLQQAYPELEVWRTRDLFIPNPEDSSLWRFVGRRDDVIVLSNGEKFNPVNMEGAITGHPLVQGSVIIGTARIQACLIVEPAAAGVELSDKDFIDEIWPTVAKANTLGPAHGRIFRHKVAVAKPNKPFARAGKGTIIRSQTANLYLDEVEALYAEGAENDSSAPKLDSVERLESVTSFIRNCAEWLLTDTKVSDSDDLFVLGMDSLQTLEFSKLLKRALGPYFKPGEGSDSFPLNIPDIYSHPTVTDLAKFIFGLVHQNATTESSSDRTVAMANLVGKYTASLSQRPQKKLCVAITGTTGSLGSYILEALLQDDNVHKIYCLNRSVDAQKRQEEGFKLRGKSYDLSTKAAFLTVSFGDDRFGLSEADFQQLSGEVDAIIHNAWKVDFNHNLPSFEKVHIRGIHDLAEFSLSSKRQPHLFFVSSISSVGNWGLVNGFDEPVPESALEDFNVALPLGYAESKHVAERILTSAIQEKGLNASIFRVGQVAGPISLDSGGVWNLSEWMPALIKTSKALRLLPDAMNTIDWIPVDTLAKIMQELLYTGCDRQRSQVYNLINPHIANWKDMSNAVQAHWEAQGIQTQVVPFQEWLDALSEAASRKDPDLEAMPAIKIFDFFVGLAQDAENCKTTRLMYDTARAREGSEAMASLGALDGDSMKIWMQQWDF